MATIDETTWDGPQAMSDAAASDDPAATYAAICAGKRDGDPAVQSTWALPHHKHAGDPPNADGVANAMQRLSQTQGLVNETAARNHLQAHMDEIHAEDMGEMEPAEPNKAMSLEHWTLDVPEPAYTLDASKRILGLKLLTYNEVVDSKYGPLMFEPGAFGQVDPRSVRLRMDHEDPPTGIGLSFKETPTAPLMEFRVSKTERGNDQLTLAADGVSRGVSVGFEHEPQTQTRRIGRQVVTVFPPNSASLAEVSTTWAPTFAEPMAGVMYALSKGEKGTGQMAEEAPVITAGIDYEAFANAIVNAQAKGATESKLETLLSKFDQMVELQRAQFSVPSGSPRKPKINDWVEVTLRRMRGESISPTELKQLALDDVITGDNPGLVPDLLVQDYNDLITPQRRFLGSTRQIVAPASGTSMLLPIITTRAVAGTQYGGEKADVTTTATKVGTGTFAYQSIFGGADISIQMIQRADRSFFDLLTGDMAFAYALDAETKAIAALLAGYTDSALNQHVVNNGGVMDPEDPHFGDAWANAISSPFLRAPDHIWLSAAAVGKFIDAKSPVTNAPLYSNLAASFTAGGGPGGVLSGLTPVYVPAMNTSGVDVIVGPSEGFVWAEDPALNLQADVPSKAGRDIALVGGIFPAPRYADAFTTYTIAS